MSKLKCRRGEVIRTIAVQMNLPDPGGGGGANYPPQCSPGSAIENPIIKEVYRILY